MKKRHNSAPWAPDEASPYLNESSRCAESESEEHFVREAHFSGHFSVKKCDFPVKQKLQNWVEITFQRNIWGQLDVRTRMRASKSRIFDLKGKQCFGHFREDLSGANLAWSVFCFLCYSHPGASRWPSSISRNMLKRNGFWHIFVTCAHEDI